MAGQLVFLTGNYQLINQSTEAVFVVFVFKNVKWSLDRNYITRSMCSITSKTTTFLKRIFSE